MYQNDSNIETAASDAAYYLIPQLEYQFASLAELNGWPDSITTQMSISYENGVLSITYPDSIKEQVDNLEYGSEGQPPRALIRNFTHRSEDAIRKVLANNTLDLLLEMQEVF